MLSYAGVTLPVWTAEAAAWVEANLTLADVLEFSRLDWPGFRYWMGCATLGTLPRRRVQPGRLFWPRGAQRFSVFHGLVDDATLALIRQATENSVYTAQPLVMTWVDAATQVEIARIQPSMFLLPARPLSQISSFNGMNLLTLVDERFFWWYYNTGALTITEGTTTWANLYTTLGAQLGIVITPDAIPAAYLKPSSSLAVPYDYVTVLLDAVAYNVGQRIVRRLDGTVVARNPVNAASDVATNLALPILQKQAGGRFLFPPATPSDAPGVLPHSVTVVFPRTDDGSFNFTYATQTVTLASLGLADLPPATVTNNGTKTFRETAPAAYTSGSPTNAAETLSLAQQVATDWYRWQVAPLDVKWCAIVPWQPDALHDSVEWSYKAMDGPQDEGDCCTRVMRPPFNDLTEDLAHGGGTGGPSIGPIGPPTGGGGGGMTMPPIILPPVTDPTSGGGGSIPVPPNTGKLLFTPAVSETITHFTGAASGTLLYILNLGPGKLTLQNNAGGAGSFLFPINFDYVLQVRDEVVLEYIGSTQRWYFAHPTLGAGTTPEYGVQQLLPGDGVTITPNGDGTASFSAPARVTGAGGDIHAWHDSLQWYSWFLATPTGLGSPFGNITTLPFLTTTPFAADLIGLTVTNSDAVSHNIRLAIYTNTNLNNLYPNQLLFDSGDQNIAGTGLATDITVGIGLNLLGLYWLAVQVDDNHVTVSSTALGLGGADYYLLGRGGPSTGGSLCWTKSFAYAAFPNPFPAAASRTTAGPYIHLHHSV